MLVNSYARDGVFSAAKNRYSQAVHVRTLYGRLVNSTGYRFAAAMSRHATGGFSIPMLWTSHIQTSWEFGRPLQWNGRFTARWKAFVNTGRLPVTNQWSLVSITSERPTHTQNRPLHLCAHA